MAGHLQWVELCPPKTRLRANPCTCVCGNSIFAEATKLRIWIWDHLDLKWAPVSLEETENTLRDARGGGHWGWRQTGVMSLQAEACQRLPESTRRWEEAVGQTQPQPLEWPRWPLTQGSSQCPALLSTSPLISSPPTSLICASCAGLWEHTNTPPSQGLAPAFCHPNMVPSRAPHPFWFLSPVSILVRSSLMTQF